MSTIPSYWFLFVAWTDTPYTIAAVPFFRVVYVLVMMKQYFNQCVNPGGGWCLKLKCFTYWL